ncbi:MAG TPA: helix-turn-helix domain-containing protein [Anaerolineae bacterium]
MRPSSSPVSLVEIIRLALPVGTEFIGEADHRSRVVKWAVVASTPLPTVLDYEPGDLVLLATATSDALLVAAIPSLSELGIAAIGFIGPASDATIAAARSANVPLIVLPLNSNLRRAHQSTLTLITNRQAQTGLRAAQVRQQLGQMVVEEAGLEAIIRAMAQLTGKGVVVQDKRLIPLASWAHPALGSVWADVLRTLGNLEHLPAGWSDRRTAANHNRIEHQALPGGLSRLIMPIVVKGVARGYLSFISVGEELDALDALAAEQGAEACALEMAKAKAVSEVTKRLRGEFLDAMLAGRVSPKEITQWAGQLGHNVAAPHAAIVLAWDGDTHPSLRRLETVLNGEIGLSRAAALVRVEADRVGAFVAVETIGSPKPARDLAEAVYARAMGEYPHAILRCGVGRPAGGILEWRTSYQEAGQALDIARQLDERRPMYFGDLSVYRLLFKMSEHPDLISFCRQTLGTLIEYDRKQNSNLIETLEAFFAHNGNLSQTAETLFIHRNTLQYRMERIAELAGIDLDNPETRLALQLALKAYRLIESKK